MARVNVPKALKVAALAAIFAGLAIAVTWPALRHLDRWGVHDWPQFYSYFGVPYRAVAEYRELPGWNPYYYGGNVQWGHADDATLSPLFVPVLLLGVVAGLKANLPIVLAGGMFSMWLLARHYRVSVVAAIFAATVWGLNGWHAYHFAVGHMDHLTFLFQPLAVLFLVKAVQDIRWSAAGGAVIALMYLSGGPYPFVFTSILTVVLALLLAGQKNSLAPLKAAAVMLAFAGGFAAVKLLTSLLVAPYSQGVESDSSGITVRWLLNGLFDPKVPMVSSFAGTQWGAWEYAAYIGFVPAAAFLLGAVFEARRMWPWLAMSTVFLVAALGAGSPVNFFSLFTAPPGLSGMHVPYRFVVHFIMAAALVGAMGIDRVAGVARRLSLPKLGVAIAAAVALFTAADLVRMHYNRPVSLYGLASYYVPPKAYGGQLAEGEEVQRLSPSQLLHVPDSYPMALPVWFAFLEKQRLATGYDATHLKRYARVQGDEGYQGEAYIAEEGAGTASVVENTLSRYRVAYDAGADATLVLSQNYFPGWKAHGAAGRVVNLDGIVAVPVAAGSGEVVFVFRPPTRTAGAAITLFTLFAAAYLARRGPLPPDRPTRKDNAASGNDHSS